MAQILNIIPKVFAQNPGPDAISQPTFGAINISGGGLQTSSILLKTTSTSTSVGERFTARVEIRTNEIAIGEYRIVVEFDPARLQVIDQDSSVAGNQIRNLDTVFLPTNLQTDNTVSASGRITFIGRIAEGNSASVNREVIEIEFQAQTAGASNLRIVSGSSGSQLIRANGVSVPFTANEVNVEISTSTSGSGVTPNPSTPPAVGGNGGGSAVVTPPTTLPDTALEAGIGDILVLLIGVMIIGLGTKIGLSKKPEKNNL